MAFRVNGSKKKQMKVGIVLSEFKEGRLKSQGRTVTNERQALAIALSEAGLDKRKKKKRSR